MEKLKQDHNLVITPWSLRGILQNELGMRYCPIKGTSWQGNSSKNLILRQHFAEAFLKVDLSKKTIVNIDETWLGMSDFRRMKWRPRGKPNSVPKKRVQPRISMITGLDTNGSVFVSLSDSNTNSPVMQLFFSHFIRMMDKKRKDWRRDTVILLDGAPYHTSLVMMEYYEEQQLPLLFTGPHSYAASPIELFFAHFKRSDINPRKLPLGKK